MNRSCIPTATAAQKHIVSRNQLSMVDVFIIFGRKNESQNARQHQNGVEEKFAGYWPIEEPEIKAAIKSPMALLTYQMAKTTDFMDGDACE
uniref:Uncharacterized protein n=1 Tax=Romanomermis culicivorax TaxID=13658 RepID=A0A915IVC4_ROMCU